MIPNTVTAVAAVFAAWVARNGLHSWRDQLRGRHAYDLATRIHLALLKVREKVTDARQPYVPASESLAAAKAEGIIVTTANDLLDPKVDYCVYGIRWDGVVVPLRELETLVLEAEVVLSTRQIRDTYPKLRRHVEKLRFAIDHHFRRRNKTSYPNSLDEKQLRIMNRPIGEDEDDWYNHELQQVIDELAQLLKPFLK